MRRSILALTTATYLLAAPAALAAPTCQNRVGDTVRCGTAGAMPVGWTLPDHERLERQASSPPGPTPAMLVGLICFVGGLFALIALMPNFDGSRPGDWDRQEGDDEEPD
jgi:hypothetical protein